MPTRLARVLLLIALLAGWQAALQHPIEHVDELGEFVHLHGGHLQEGEGDAGLLCDLLAALATCAAQPHAAFDALRADYESSSYPTSAPRVAEAPPFLSQGPPITRV